MPINPSQLAGRGARLAARIIDGIITSVPFFIVLPGILALMATVASLDESGMSEDEIAYQLGLIVAQSGMATNILIALGSWIVIAIIQIVLLTQNGQTIGKKLLGVKIVMHDTGKNGGFVPNVLLRAFVNGLLSAIPFYKLVDVLFIFREDKRCVHDLIAKTSVVKA